MNLTQIVGKKIDQSQAFLENGKRVPMSRISVNGNVISQIKTVETDGYNALQIGFGNRNKATKAIAGHIKKAGIEKTPRFFREIRVNQTPDLEIGAILNIAEILEPGDIVNVTGTSKGKGFAGAVKRWNFRGGPRTHGQSNRERAPGSSGSGTTPGRVFKGKRRAGHMGVDTATVRNLEVLEITNDGVVLLKGLVPGIKGQIVMITRVGKTKKHTPLYKTEGPSIAEALKGKEKARLAEDLSRDKADESKRAAIAAHNSVTADAEAMAITEEEIVESSDKPEEIVVEEASKEEVAKESSEVSKEEEGK